jgi:nucleoside-diphosphate-sugar epimerase
MSDENGTGAFDAATYAGVRTLVLGATGFIGQHVAAALAARGADLYLAGRDARGLAAVCARAGTATIETCNLADANAVADLIRNIRPAATFNLAGYGVDPRERDETTAFRLNAELPSLLAELIAAVRRVGSWSGQALVHTGSALEYGTAAGDLRETTRPLPTTLYGRSKLEGTHAIAAHCRWSRLPAVTARLFTVYGPGEHAGRLLPSLIETARTGITLDLTAGTQRRDFGYVEEIAEGLLRLGAARAEPGEAVNLATGTLTTVRDFALRAMRALGGDPALLRFGAVSTRAEEMSHDPVAIDRLRALTGWAPRTTIESGVARTADAVLASGR